MTTRPSPKQWEIWHARFDFSDKKGYKHRPVIVIGTNPDASLVMMVTSSTNKLALEHDYSIQAWKEAGLDKPSIARVDRIAQIPPGYLGSAGKIGVLSKRDINAITIRLNEMLADKSLS